jgi:hypothetical protein
MSTLPLTKPILAREKKKKKKKRKRPDEEHEYLVLATLNYYSFTERSVFNYSGYDSTKVR